MQRPLLALVAAVVTLGCQSAPRAQPPPTSPPSVVVVSGFGGGPDRATWTETVDSSARIDRPAATASRVDEPAAIDEPAAGTECLSDAVIAEIARDPALLQLLTTGSAARIRARVEPIALGCGISSAELGPILTRALAYREARR